MVLTNKKAIVSISMGHFVADMYAAALVPLYPYISDNLGITLAIMSAIISIGHLFSSAMQPLFGFLADQSKHRTFMIWGLVLGAIFIPLAALMPHVLLLAVSLILGMCGNSLFHPQATAMISVFNYNNPKLSKYMGIFLGVGTIGYAISPMLSSSLVQDFGPMSLLYIAVLGLAAAAMLYYNVPKIPFKAARRSKEKFTQIMSNIWHTPELVSLLGISVMKSIITISYATYMPFLLKSYGYSIGQIGLIMTCFFTCAGFATVLSTKIENRIGSANVIRLSFFTILPLTIIFLALFKANLGAIALIFFFIQGFCAMLSVSITMCTAQKLMPTHKGVISGAMGGFSWSIAALSLLPLGYLAEKFGIDNILYLVGTIALFAGTFCITRRLKIVLKKHRRCEITEARLQ